MAAQRRVWQVSGGPASRSYASVFLKYGVALIGPGDAGAWAKERYAYDFALQGFVGRFAEEVREGDVLLLSTGNATVAAVGIVASGYMYLDRFDDVNGRDLQHARRARWFRLPQEHRFQSPVFSASPSRFSGVIQADALDFAERFVNSPPTHWQFAPLPELPAEQPQLVDVPTELRGLVAHAGDLVPLYQDQKSFGGLPAEDEMVVHFVVPLLRALGWPTERIAVQWRHIDVAVFRSLPRTPENCLFVIEAKFLGAGVEGALDQAIGYVKALGVQRDAVVTDGIRYRMYSGERSFEPVAYANLARLKQPAADLFARIRRP